MNEREREIQSEAIAQYIARSYGELRLAIIQYTRELVKFIDPSVEKYLPSELQRH
jgi:hypothetical protein